MRKVLLLVVFLFAASVYTYAQDDYPAKFSVGFNAGATIGPNASAYPFNGALTLKLQLPVGGNSGVYVVATTGYNYYISADGYYTGYTSTSGNYSYGSIASFIPVQIGVKAYVVNKFFVQGDVGASFSLNSSTAKKAALLVSPAVGYTINFGSSRYGVDLGLGYANRFEPNNSYSQIEFKAAFNIGI